MTSEALEAIDIVQVDDYGRILLPHGLQDKVGISPHDKLTVGLNGDVIVTRKNKKQSVFDLQRKNVRDGTLKEALASTKQVKRICRCENGLCF